MRTSTMMQTGVLAALALSGAACGQSTPAGPRVFFVTPADGATVQSPVHLEFGAEAFQTAAVTPGTPPETRPALGHHHVGIDTDCLPPGTAIPRAAAWVHFGDGKNVIEMQLPPGQHRLTLQVGDDLHQTIEGLCSTITVNVTG